MLYELKCFKPAMIVLTVAGLTGCATGGESKERTDEIAPVISFDLTCKRHINGVSALDRAQYFNLHSGGESDAVWDYLKSLDLNLNLGRGIGGVNWYFQRVPEDPSSNGYASAAWLLEHKSMRPTRHVPNEEAKSEIIVTGSPTYPEYLKKNERGTYVDGNAAAALWANVLRAICGKESLPAYVEVMNEPDTLAFNGKLRWDDIAENHVAVAVGLRKEFPGIKVGGPCLAWPAFSKDGFKVWDRGMKSFIDQAGAKMDFLAMHCYDFYGNPSRGKGQIYSGGRDEANLDLVENYSFNKLGLVKPLVVSEYGAFFRKADDVPDPESLQQWLMLDGVCSKLMTFMERPDRIAKSVPFILGDTSAWNPTYYAAMIRKRGDTYVENHLTKFYRFWREVDGDRILTDNRDSNVQATGFLNGRTAYLCLNNLSKDGARARLDWNAGGARVLEALVSRLYFDEEPKLVSGEKLIDRLIDLRGNEKVIVKLRLDREPRLRKGINEVWSYGDRTLAPISAGKAETFLLNVGANGNGKARYAELRLGLSRPHGKGLIPEVEVNGKRVAVPQGPMCSAQEEFDEYFGMKAFRIPLEVLKTDGGANRVDVRYPDDGGFVATVALVVGYETDGAGY